MTYGQEKPGVAALLDKGVVVLFDESVVACLDKNNKDDFDVDFSLHTPWYRFSRKPWVDNVWFTVVI